MYSNQNVMTFRIEKDTMGAVKVPADKLWGAQTERSRNNFRIGSTASMPISIIYGFAYLNFHWSFGKRVPARKVT